MKNSKIAKRFARGTPNMKALPAKIKRKKGKKKAKKVAKTMKRYPRIA